MASAVPNTSDLLDRLPNELHQNIADRVFTPRPSHFRGKVDPSKDPSIAPSDGSSPFLRMPRELRRKIFGHALPAKDKVIEPCKPSTRPERDAAAAAERSSLSLAAKRDTPKSLKVGDILVLNKQIASEILVMLYEERTFAINVYEGIFDGGIEFLNSGLQRLQYREHFTQVRFKRFEKADDPFGFARVKRLLIRIYPAKESASEQKTSRHDSMHTHFMLRALVKLLQTGAGSGLNRLQICFVEPQTTEWRPRPWQNTSDSSPRCTSIHGVSNVEVVLRGLVDLRGIHVAICELPPDLYRDRALSGFVDRLQGVITGKINPDVLDDYLTLKIEGAKDVLDDWIHSLTFGTDASKAVPGVLEDSDFVDEKDAGYFELHPDEDHYYDFPSHSGGNLEQHDRNRAPTLRNTHEKRIAGLDENQETAAFQGNKSERGFFLEMNNIGGRPSRTNSKRRYRRTSPLDSSSRESSGGASLVGMLALSDDGDLQTSQLRRSERLRLRSRAYDLPLTSPGFHLQGPSQRSASGGTGDALVIDGDNEDFDAHSHRRTDFRINNQRGPPYSAPMHLGFDTAMSNADLVAQTPMDQRFWIIRPRDSLTHNDLAFPSAGTDLEAYFNWTHQAIQGAQADLADHTQRVSTQHETMASTGLMSDGNAAQNVASNSRLSDGAEQGIASPTSQHNIAKKKDEDDEEPLFLGYVQR